MAREVLIEVIHRIMLKFLASLLNRMSAGESLKAAGAAGAARAAREAAIVEEEEEEEHAQVFESLAMTDELREALFPKTTQMVSAIFDRPLNERNSPPPSAPPPARDGGGPR